MLVCLLISFHFVFAKFDNDNCFQKFVKKIKKINTKYAIAK